jgi:hypothetical protein
VYKRSIQRDLKKLPGAEVRRILRQIGRYRDILYSSCQASFSDE